MAGYSVTPLWKKLGYKNQLVAWTDNPPVNYRQLLDLPKEISVAWQPRLTKGVAFVHTFVRSCGELKKKIGTLRASIAEDGVLWVSWPKKSSGVPCDLTEERVRELALPLGLVDIKVCAVDAVWSGLKLMIRREQRGQRRVTS